MNESDKNLRKWGRCREDFISLLETINAPEHVKEMLFKHCHDMSTYRWKYKFHLLMEKIEGIEQTL